MGNGGLGKLQQLYFGSGATVSAQGAHYSQATGRSVGPPPPGFMHAAYLPPILPRLLLELLPYIACIQSAEMTANLHVHVPGA